MSTETGEAVPQDEAPVEAGQGAPSAGVRAQRPTWLIPGAIGLVAGLVIGASGLALVQSIGGGSSGRFDAAVEYCTDGGTGNGLEIGDNGRTLTIDTDGDDEIGGTGIEYGLCVLDQLDVPDSVMSRIENTTSMDGQVEGSWDGITATWTYHPDRGLDVVLTVD